MWANYDSTYQVATLFQKAGITMNIYRVLADAEGHFECEGTLVENGDHFKPKVPGYTGKNWERTSSIIGSHADEMYAWDLLREIRNQTKWSDRSCAVSPVSATASHSRSNWSMSNLFTSA
jgi:hypothetical protein